ncbi:4-diphosphocytidyl-2-C-methyl-D-erythritol kinase [Ruminiclostridium hungatei]|uniref:4-diphosphocytidyl-2-C-methyl-D-erythritol kinase n=1 Tax=Ruminiclostridium hungatei TaxID=48256 RepID=A0A1V4SR80_RUMHU|nr:4-(cytidine 5'-diphospho)-2-C-methyl-D-erythritol kinase [Ruminiclostridium hungatei]OPX45791.1 4-diphosphocytidyl-2-C-methyl-D-erythritol kinase [Ruminiclostridium hungatei]
MISLKAHAKINLSLDVLSRRDDGYHTLQMIMQTIQLHDTITLEKIPSGVEIICEAPYVPDNSSNIAYKAAEAMLQQYNIQAGVKIEITKKIPVAAGLAGGSTDAAAVLKGINMLFELGIEPAEMMRLGKTIGADVPYCIMGGTALAEGIGEILTSLPPAGNIPLLLVKPRIGVSTAWVYKSLEVKKITGKPDTKLLMSAISAGDISTLALNMKNVLESVTCKRFPVIENIKKDLIRHGALGSMMSGSGPTVFGIFEDVEKAEYAFDKLKNSKHECILTHTV